VTGAPPILVASTRDRDAADRDLRRLLVRAYVDGGFTEPERASEIFAPGAVRGRGEVLCAWLPGLSGPVGMVVISPASSSSARFAVAGEAEMQLLATMPEHQGRGVGRALVGAAMREGHALGARRLLLWTQPSMLAAQRLYAREGFVREPARDFSEGGRPFLFYAVELEMIDPR
jgi:ribosomal protein S18 acetylase RimI-like enzyme